MPEGYTHVRTARKAAETIHYKIQCPAAFAAGANGPDSFFCFEIWKKRAKRRYDELTEKGETCDLAAIEADIIERDKRDMEREFAPLRQAEDATYVDSSDMTIDEVITAITDLIH